MNKSIYNSIAGNNPAMSQFMDRLNQFKSQFQGDPRETVQNMLNSGRITQAQFNRAQQIARQIMGNR